MSRPVSFERAFTEQGDFAALDAAEAFCGKVGLSVGRMQRGDPRGLLFGDFDIAKWRNLSAADRASLHGEMIGGRLGPVAIRLFENAPREAVARAAALVPADATQ